MKTTERCCCEQPATTTITVGGYVYHVCRGCQADFKRNHNADGSFKSVAPQWHGSYEASILAEQEENYL